MSPSGPRQVCPDTERPRRAALVLVAAGRGYAWSSRAASSAAGTVGLTTAMCSRDRPPLGALMDAIMGQQVEGVAGGVEPGLPRAGFRWRELARVGVVGVVEEE